jgi:hypothetical protein
MFVLDSCVTLLFAREHADRLRDEAVADRLRCAARRHRTLVASMRRVACRCRIDAAPIAHRPV